MFILVLIYTTLFISTRSVSTCQTPSHQSGVCKKITECPSVYSLVQQRPISPENAKYLRKSQCGFSENSPKVCCPDQNFNSIAPTTSRNVNEIPLLKHNLLPDKKICGMFAENRIYRGTGVAFDQYPWNALLKYSTKDNSTKFYCAGVLISEKYVLTAAHCISGRYLPKNASLTSVRFGEHDIMTDPDCEGQICAPIVQDVPIEETILHNKYHPDNLNSPNDIALIRLKSKISYSEFISPLCLPGQIVNYTEGTLMQASGWGINNNDVYFSTKLSVRDRVKNSSLCEEAFKVKLDQNQICLQEEKVCSSDSGGSVFFLTIGDYVNAYSSAIKSFGSCILEGRPMVYTRVDRYTDWIINTLKP